MLIKKGILKAIKAMGYEVHKITTVAPPVPIQDEEIYRRYYSLESIKQKRFYNIGAGTFRHPYWTNIDLASEWYSECQQGSNMINFDLFSLQRLPLDGNCAELVYTSHTIEHINDAATQNMFNEAYRILKKGGKFRVTTPDIDLYYRAYRNQDVDFFWWRDLYSQPEISKQINAYSFETASLAQFLLFAFASHVSEMTRGTALAKVSDAELEHMFAYMSYEDVLNNCAKRCTVECQMESPGHHMNWFNEEKLRKMLVEAGFVDIFKSGYGQSTAAVLRDTLLFDKQDVKESIYMEAVK